jgi:superfamily II DNA or RNA helicase
VTRSLPWPRIVAEALRRVDDRAHFAGRGTTCAPLASILDAIDAAQAPPRSGLGPPEFLQAHQHDPWRRTMAALDAWRGALLLEPIGSGKTWIALAVAAHERGRVVAIVPAILRAQWEDAAVRAKVALHVWTHERASRGAVPQVRPSLVIIDEAHRLRDPATRRVRTLAPWLVGCRVLLLSATPIVNRLGDLITLLRLAVPEDALALDGIARLIDLATCPRPPAGLRRVAIRSTASSSVIDRRVTTLQPDGSERDRAAAAVTAIDQLELSANAAIRRLLITVLLDAAASSDAALQQALKRYRALLLQSRDAGSVSRSMLRQFAGQALDQLVFWPLVAAGPATTDLPLADVARVEQLLTKPPADDSWVRALVTQCDDARPTICFTRHRATAQQLRVALGDDTAWITGSAAGIGPHHVPRAAVLAAFGPDRAAWRIRRVAPRMLIATDVAAEGLDLQSAGRIVHVDLPWTATRIDQREGRLLRIGQQHPHVEVVVRLPGPSIEIALARHARVRRKRRVADEWLQVLEVRDRAAQRPSTGPLVAGFADDGDAADLVAVRLQRDGCTGVVLMTRERGGTWCTDARTAAALIDRARAAAPLTIDRASISIALAEAARAAAANCASSDCGAPALVSRIHRLARQAAAKRDGDALRQLDRLLRFATTPQTLGGRAIIADLQELSDRECVRRDVPEMPCRAAAQASVIAAVLFRSSLPPLRCSDAPAPDRPL